MDTRSRNFLDMVRTVNTALAEPPATVTIPPVLTGIIVDLSTRYGRARSYARRTEPSDGVLHDDKEAKLKAAATSLALALGTLKGHAARIGDDVLRARTDRSMSDLYRLDDGEIIGELESYATTLRDNLTALADSGVTVGEIDAIDDQIDAAEAALGGPQGQRGDRAAAVTLLDEEIDAIRALLTDQLDPFISRFAADPDETTRDYGLRLRSARVIRDIGEGGSSSSSGSGSSSSTSSSSSSPSGSSSSTPAPSSSSSAGSESSSSSGSSESSGSA